MQKQFEIIRNTRRLVTALSDKYSIDQLNHIPENYSNNLAWHVGHLVATQQMFCYKLAGLPYIVDEQVVEKYKRGTRPESFISADEMGELKTQLITGIDRFEQDLQKGIFSAFTPFTTQLGLQLNSIEDAITTIVFHEGVHLGYMLGMKRYL